jgi:hypothetical protein
MPWAPSLQSGSFIVRPVVRLDGTSNGIGSPRGNVGSLSGGLPLRLSVDWGLLAAGPNNFSSNVITIGGLPCPRTSVPTRTSITCEAPAVTGFVQAEFWNLNKGVMVLPELQTWTNPREDCGLVARGAERLCVRAARTRPCGAPQATTPNAPTLAGLVPQQTWSIVEARCKLPGSRSTVWRIICPSLPAHWPPQHRLQQAPGRR